MRVPEIKLWTGRPDDSGEVTRQFLIAPGDRIRTEFERLGAVEATFV